MHSVWFKGVEDEDKKEAELRSYKLAFDALKEILEDEQERYHHPNYDTPNWAYRQADRNGYDRAIRHVIKLIEIEEA